MRLIGPSKRRIQVAAGRSAPRTDLPCGLAHDLPPPRELISESAIRSCRPAYGERLTCPAQKSLLLQRGRLGSHYLEETCRALTDCGKLAALKGHGFSRALSAAKSVTASAAEGWFSSRSPSVSTRLRIALVCLLLALAPFTAWTWRNWHVFHVVQPLAPRYATDPGENGYD